MSTSALQNPHLALAQHLSNPRVLSTEEKLFRDALKTVEDQRRKTQTLPEIFDNLNHAQTIEDVKFMLENEKSSSTLWKKPLGKSWLRIFSKYAEYIWFYKGILDPVVTRSPSLAAPIWGSIAFVINVFKDLGTAVEYLERAERTLEASMRRFGRYFEKGKALSADLQAALLTYYEKVIEFAIDVHKEFSTSLTDALFRLLHRTLQIRLESFNKDIRDIVDDVDKGANIDNMEDIQSQISALNSSLGSLSGSQGGQRRTALYGMGGIGKTQILIRYAYDHLHPHPQSHPYDTVVWINATNDTTVKNAISSFMDINGFREPLVDDQGNVRFSPFHNRLHHHSKRWLLIFDNVTDYHHVRGALPQGINGHILFSTRHKLIAEQVAPISDNIEILPMDEDSGIHLVSNLAQASENIEDRSRDVARKTAEFARGLPIVMEQLVNNAILSRRSLTSTLDMVRKKTDLLRQQNISSLHDDNLCLGAIVMQTFETLESRFPRAEALFKIMAYLEPSSMPISLFQDAHGKFQDFLDRQCTYTRGALIYREGHGFDRTNALHAPQQSPRQSERRRHFRAWSPFKKSKLHQHPDESSDLPVDDSRLTASLREVFGPGTALGLLFENQVMLDDAIQILINTAIIRKLNDNELWMHDLVSEVTRALLSESIISNQRLSLAAATMVYIAFPTPERSMAGLRDKLCSRYLPHAISCHSTLKDAGILNDCSIGPELSHLIASTLDRPTARYDKQNSMFFTQEQMDEKARVMRYYREAYTGYLAGWRRLKTEHGVSDKDIFIHIKYDRECESRCRVYGTTRYEFDCERLGCNAPWRAIQTASKLGYRLGDDPATVDEGLACCRAALGFYKLAFGVNDRDSISMKLLMVDILSSARRWREAHDIGVQGIKDLLGQQSGDLSNTRRWREAYDAGIQGIKDLLGQQPADHKDNAPSDLESMAKDPDAWRFASRLGRCCMELSDEESLPPDEVRAWAREAIMWIEMHSRRVMSIYGQDEHYNTKIYVRLAEAHQKAADPYAALYWYARGVFCDLAHMVWEHEIWDDGPGQGAVVIGGEDMIRETVDKFENAMATLLGEGEGKIGRLEDFDINFQKVLYMAKSRIALWRADREKHGVFDPYKEDRDRLQREYEEQEAKIQAEEEEMYGKIPDLRDPESMEIKDDDENPVKDKGKGKSRDLSPEHGIDPPPEDQILPCTTTTSQSSAGAGPSGIRHHAAQE